MKRLSFFVPLLFSLYGFSQEVINMDGVACGLNGAAAEGSRVYILNQYKNRYQVPSASDFDPSISFQNLMQSGDPNQFSPEKAITLTGYVFNVKVGGIESCNCKSKDPNFRDTHIELTPDENHTDPQYRVIVEVTPRLREAMATKGLDWTTQGLRQSIKGYRVKIEGWLLYDAEHESAAFANDPADGIGAKNWRATCWEIHPITSIEILNPDSRVLPPTRHKEVATTPHTEVIKEDSKPALSTENKQGNSSFPLILLGLFVAIIILVFLLFASSKK